MDSPKHSLPIPYSVTLGVEAEGPPEDDPEYTVDLLATDDDHALALVIRQIERRYPGKARQAWYWHIERHSTRPA